MRNWKLVVMVALCPLLLAASDEVKPAAPKSPAATAAIAKHDKSLADAAAAYRDAKNAADKAYVAELKKAQADILKAGGPAALTEANAIQSVIDSTLASLEDRPHLVLLVKGTAEVWANGKQVTKAGSGELADIPIARGTMVTVKLQSDVNYRSFRITVCDSAGNVIRSFKAEQFGLTARDPDEGFKSGWKAVDAGQWIYIPDKNKVHEIKVQL